MRLTELFAAPDLVVDFAPADKWEAIRILVEHLVQRGTIAADQAETVLEAIQSRERSMSTGMEEGIAIPHAAVDEIDTVAAAMGIVGPQEGLAFESIDGRPARLVVLLAIPRRQKLLHIRTLADVARLLGRESVRTALTAAATSEEAWRALAAGEAATA
ncbi:MAG TPA: PTS sugar transporter subunit IIA [Planctomycetota bacterium]|nr:PTS sugar transporter subunit IIA [Planctomycetota bacterium]